jgi:NAD-dependent dihydropyrimidine dehydrogenase PreA subunit
MSVGDAIRECVQSALRLLPWPTEPGLRRVGNPGAESPVLITGNYDLTVRRLIRSLAGTDAWLVVAPSQGINVWCAAAGGLLSSSQVVTALKTCGIDNHVRHRRAILPQLAATGVVAADVSRRCGWKVRFGPVYAEDIPRYLAANGQKDDSMRRVRFDALERIEMATAWSAPTSLVVAVVMLFVETAWILPAMALVWAMSIGVFFAYDRLGRGRLLKAWVASAVPAVAFVMAADGSMSAIIAALVVATVTLAVLTFDFAGSTPIEGGSHFESKDWSINLDTEKCVGVYSCWAVCPEACFDKREDLRKVDLSHENRCIKCGACVVQCPQDALYFAADDGRRRIEPETIRRYKLNLLGSRAVDTGEARIEQAESIE